MAARKFHVWRWDEDGWTKLDGAHPSKFAAQAAVVSDSANWGSLYAVLPAGEVPE